MSAIKDVNNSPDIEPPDKPRDVKLSPGGMKAMQGSENTEETARVDEKVVDGTADHSVKENDARNPSSTATSDNAKFNDHATVQGAPDTEEKAHQDVVTSDQKLESAGSEKEVIQDKQGKALSMSSEGSSPEKIQKAIANDTQNINHPIYLRVRDENNEVGRANLTLETQKNFNEKTGHYDQVQSSRMRLNDILVPDANRKQGVGTKMLEKSEQVAQQSGASELYGFPENDNAQKFFRNRGYQVRYKENGAPEVFKKMNPKKESR